MSKAGQHIPRLLRVVSISAELAPFSKTGGLGEVARMMPKAIAALGHEAVYLTVLHHSVDPAAWGLAKLSDAVPVRLGNGMESVGVWQGDLDGIPVYFIDHPHFFSKPETIYLTGYDDERFFLFCHAVFAVLEFLQIQPDVLHAHDWHAALVPYLLKHRFRRHPLFSRTVSVYTIHNLAFQMERNWWEVPPEERDNGKSALPEFSDKTGLRRVNYALRGIQAADALTTVSQKYAEEILSKEFGENLHRVLYRRKGRLTGILHGVDYETYNPATDPGLAAKYDAGTIEKKSLNKQALQDYFGLPRKKLPVIGMVSRITEQKGFELIVHILEHLLKWKLQLVIMGKGDSRYERLLSRASNKHSRHFAIRPFEQTRETLVYAGSDIYLMPSRFEPCGLGQLISLRYGSIPVVHAVGGLAETIVDFNPETKDGNGFVFSSYNTYQLFGAIVRAIVNYRHHASWLRLVKRAMREVFSWELPAKRYAVLYRSVVRERYASFENLPAGNHP